MPAGGNSNWRLREEENGVQVREEENGVQVKLDAEKGTVQVKLDGRFISGDINMAKVMGTTYDEVPYASYPYPQSSPDRLATVARLFGLQPAPVEHCRVLELGCASGGNLIPLAECLPESTFAGIDLSEKQLAEGRRAIEELGLKNIRLDRRNITEVGKNFGQFDYIICHGVYSWVPAAVQDHILTVCKENLATNGVAYVSYNTMPGWHMRGMIRDMMLFHGRQFAGASERAGQARALLKFLARSLDGNNNPYGAFLKNEVELLQGQADSYLLHDHLEENNHPCYFHEFMDKAAGKGLQYLGESDVSSMVPGNFPPEVSEVLRELSADTVYLEQYMDFLRNRMFRQTLLCHADCRPCYEIKPEQLAEFYMGSPARPVSAQCDIASSQFEQFQTPSGLTVSTREPIVKAALVVLGEIWPQSLVFPKLRALARARLQPGPVQDSQTIAYDTQQLGLNLLQCNATAFNQVVEFSLRPPRVVCKPGNQPLARPLARWQAEQGNLVTNLRHETISLNPFERHLLKHLDGQHDRENLLLLLTGLVAKGELTVQHEGETVAGIEGVKKLLGLALEDQLLQLARNSLILK